MSTAQTTSTSALGVPEGKRLEGWLGVARSHAKLMLIGQGVAWVIGTGIAAVMLGGVLDYLLRAPAWLRGIGLVVAFGALAGLVRGLIVPALKFAPSLTEIALKIENAPAGRGAGLGDRLASAVDLARTGDRAGLAEPVVADAVQRLESIKTWEVLRPKSTGLALAWVAAWVLAMASVLASSPTLALTGAARMLWPFGGAEWPKRTEIADVTDVEVHPRGTALALRAALTRWPRNPGEQRITARYRVVEDGRAGAWKSAVLTSQDRTVTIRTPRSPEKNQGVLFERLIEPTGLKAETASPGVAEGKAQLEYTLESADDQTEMRRIELVHPPMVVSAEAVVTPPGYAERLGLTSGVSRLELGAGTDERASPAPVLGGSEVALVIHLNKAVPTPSETDHAQRVAWIARCLGADAAKLADFGGGGGATLQFSGSTWTLRWRVDGAVRLVVRPVDEHGISSGDDATFRIDAVKDNPPTASVITPVEDKAVLPTAVVRLVGEARDDVGLEEVRLECVIARAAGGKHEPVSAAAQIAKATMSGVAAPKALQAETSLELSTMTLATGDELWITAVARDAYELEGVRHQETRSSVRKLRVLSRDELVEQVWGELSAVRRSAIRLDQEQQEAAGQSTRSGEEAARRAERSQAGISERLSRQSRALAQVRERLDENGLIDQDLRQVLKDAERAVEKAGERSLSATQALADAGKAQASEGATAQDGQAERERALREQGGVREELARLVDMLDRGEDTFASKRAVERLIEQQKALQQRTASAGEKSAGKQEKQLSEQERQELGQIAQEQRSIAEQLEGAVQKMGQREKKLSQTDPAAAAAMAQAAKRAERDQAAQKMKNAAQQVQQNQVGTAQQQQAQARQTMEQMLRDLEQAATNRDQVLRRQLASLIESLQGLIVKQEANLKLLDQREAGENYAGLDAGMVQLHQNTLGVLDQAERGERELRPVAAVIEKAGEAQAAAATHLRATPVKPREARLSEQESLERLNEALELAQKSDEQAEQRQDERKREELREKYLDALQRQLAMKAVAEELAGAEQSRRTKAAARQLGEEQEALRVEMEALHSKTDELKDAKVFDYAHGRLDEAMSKAGAMLSQGQATGGVVAKQTTAARVLKSLADALEERKKKDKPFREGQSGGSQGGGGQDKQPLLPPALEVILLRDMQVEAAELTRAGDQASGAERTELVREAAQLQADVARQGQELLERVTKKDEPEPTATPVGEIEEGGER